jgi:hypothetical protein
LKKYVASKVTTSSKIARTVTVKLHDVFVEEFCVQCKDTSNLLSDTSPECGLGSGFIPFPEDATMTFSSYYEDALGTSAEMSDRHEHVVHFSVFMAYCRSELQKYTLHITNVHEQKNAHKMFDQNLLPHQLQSDIDFSQNFKINKTRDETQLGNWSTVGCTLFVSVLRFICLTTWNLEPQYLSESQPVYVLIDDEAGEM